MPTQTAESAAKLAETSNRDLELCKVLTGAALSQILFARSAFRSSCFQILPLSEVVSRSFEEIITTGTALPDNQSGPDLELLRDKEYTLFFREDVKHYDSTRFLSILLEDIFPLLEREYLIKFRVHFMQSLQWTPNCLLESFALVFDYHPDGKYSVGVWREAASCCHVSETEFSLWNLGDYLSRLPRNDCTLPMFCKLAKTSTQRMGEPSVGLWDQRKKDCDEAHAELQSRPGYQLQNIASIQIAPLPIQEHSSRIIPDSPGDLIEFSDPEPGTPPTANEVPKELASESGATAPGTKIIEAALRDLAIQVLNHPVFLNATKKRADNSPESLARTSKKAKTSQAGRAPKSPLKIFEHPASDLGDTQEVVRGTPDEVYHERNNAESNMNRDDDLLLRQQSVILRTPSPPLIDLNDDLTSNRPETSPIPDADEDQLPVLPRTISEAWTIVGPWSTDPFIDTE